MSIGTKLLIIILSVSVVSEILVGISSYSTIKNLGTYSKEVANDLGARVGSNTEFELRWQSEQYLSKISETLADKSDGVFKELSNEINSTVLGIEKIFKDTSKSGNNAVMPNLPENYTEGKSFNRDNATIKAYMVDRESSDDNNIFIYNSSDYANEKNVYKVDRQTFDLLTDEEKNNLKNNYIIVSNNEIPNSTKSEISKINNFENFMESLYKSNNVISSIYIGTESGIVYEYSPYSAKTRFDPKTRPWYNDAVTAYKNDNKNPVWQSSYYSINTGSLCITVSKAYTDSNDNIIGVIAMDVYLSDLQSQIEKFKVSDTGYIFVLDNEGQIVVSSEKEDEKIFSSHPLETEIDESYENVLTKMLSGSSGVQEALISGNKYYVAYHPMETTKWSMAIMNETEQILSPITQANNFTQEKISESKEVINQQIISVIFKYMAMLILCLALVVLIGGWMSNEIVKPLKRLKKGARKIGKGDLSVRFMVESSDEVGELAATFNKMTHSLQDYIDNLAKTTKEKEKIHSELTIAKKIQRSMLPCIFPAFPERTDFDIYALMDPAKEVGGDFYDFFFVDEDNIALVIADVSGKGVSAALFMVIAKILIKNQIMEGVLPWEALKIVNNQLCENNDAGMFVTAFLGVLNIKTGKFSYSNAGHNPPVIYRSKENSLEWIKSSHGFVLAGVKDMEYKKGEIHLSSNDVLYLYTDGVTEAQNSDDEFYSKERLEETLKLANVNEISVKDSVDYIRQSIDKFIDGAERSDDITILAAKILPSKGDNKED